MRPPTVLVPLDARIGIVDEVRASTLELITLGRTLGRVDVVTLSAPSTAVLVTLSAYGVHLVHQAQLPTTLDSFAQRTTSVLGEVLTTAIRRVDADVLLAPNHVTGTEAAAVAAYKLAAGFVTDAAIACWDEQANGRVLRVTKRALSGQWLVDVEIATDPAVLTVAANSMTAAPAAVAGLATVEPLPVEVGALAATGVTVTGRQVREPSLSGRPELEQAALVVCGGRGTNGNFGPIFEIADTLGAAVGATRDVVFEGVFDRYIGQTGVTVSPRLYLGAGVSGAPHHRGGMESAAVIVAVNNDPDAPIFEFADFGVVGDLAAMLPAAAAQIAEYRAQRDSE